MTCIETRTLSIGSQSAPFIVNADAAQTDRTPYYLPDSLGTHGTYEMAGMFPWHLPPLVEHVPHDGHRCPIPGVSEVTISGG